MPQTSDQNKRNVSPDWFVQGILARLGDMFDRLTGRGWKPASSLATSEVIERLRKLLDAEASANGDGRRYVPHNIKLKMQWDKFAIDSTDGQKALEDELLTAIVDHINDRRYYTYAPLALEIKPDYFTSGVKLTADFGKFEAAREAEINVSVFEKTLAAGKLSDIAAIPEAQIDVRFGYFAVGEQITKTIGFKPGKRIRIGRTKDNDIVIADDSVSKVHASLVMTPDGRLVLADTGSTNGTFVGGQRIAYGRAVEIAETTKIEFGTVEVRVERTAPAQYEVSDENDGYKVGEFEFSSGDGVVEKSGIDRTQTAPQTDVDIINNEK
ncbi:MAG: FHA domain-containing protein [Pyrinomonadaceae bacterium]